MDIREKNKAFSFGVSGGRVALDVLLIRRFIFAGHCSSSRLVRTLGIRTDGLLKQGAACVSIDDSDNSSR